MHWQYVVPGYVVVFGGLAVYTAQLLRRARLLAERVDPSRHRFLDEEG